MGIFRGPFPYSAGSANIRRRDLAEGSAKCPKHNSIRRAWLERIGYSGSFDADAGDV